MNKVTLILIIIICTAPIILANALFYIAPSWLSGSDGSQHGELLPKAVPLTDFQSFSLVDQTSYGLKELHGHWRLLIEADLNQCDEVCERELIELRQLRLALGEDLQRLRNVIIAPEPVSAANLQKYQAAFPRFDLLGEADDITQQITAAFGNNISRGDVVLIDPLGNLVMRYPAGSGPEGKVDDLRRLFKYSQL